jgi:hypothetical protein
MVFLVYTGSHYDCLAFTDQKGQKKEFFSANDRSRLYAAFYQTISHCAALTTLGFVKHAYRFSSFLVAWLCAKPRRWSSCCIWHTLSRCEPSCLSRHFEQRSHILLCSVVLIRRTATSTGESNGSQNGSSRNATATASLPLLAPSHLKREAGQCENQTMAKSELQGGGWSPREL